ncbi:hypothetical protein PoB_005790300 [Plakobranchus ocellatus]|uniref:Uncharacterized protein n=1 Tax=Plakobranchus ocellatus TaxID=259542 RepID=A0AAV4CIJ0_9GAST|nr:hypothetical protein PoB_005790300 [Plakobranchus ocellatus]
MRSERKWESDNVTGIPLTRTMGRESESIGAAQAPANLVGLCPPCPYRRAAVVCRDPSTGSSRPPSMLHQWAEISLMCTAYTHGFEFLSFLYIASPQQGDLRLSGPPSGQGAVAGLEPATEGSLQISGRTRKPLCYRRPSIHTET